MREAVRELIQVCLLALALMAVAWCAGEAVAKHHNQNPTYWWGP